MNKKLSVQPLRFRSVSDTMPSALDIISCIFVWNWYCLSPLRISPFFSLFFFERRSVCRRIKTMSQFKWATLRQNQQNGMCAQRSRSAWASAQSDQRFRCPHEESLVLSYPLSAQQKLWSDWSDAEADLSLRWAHSLSVGFVMRRLMS